ncbi:MAG: hypothetical protein ACK4J1_02795 [Hylemonella sp.]
MVEPLPIPSTGCRRDAQGHDQPRGENDVKRFAIDERRNQYESGEHQHPAIEQTGFAMEILFGNAQTMIGPQQGGEPCGPLKRCAAQDVTAGALSLQCIARLDRPDLAGSLTRSGLPQQPVCLCIPARDFFQVTGGNFDPVGSGDRWIKRDPKPHRRFGKPGFVLLAVFFVREPGQRFLGSQFPGLIQQRLKLKLLQGLGRIPIVPGGQGQQGKQRNRKRDDPHREGPEQFFQDFFDVRPAPAGRFHATLRHLPLAEHQTHRSCRAGVKMRPPIARQCRA